MRFTEFLRTSVLLFAGAATALAAVAIAAAASKDDTILLFVSLSWWIIAAAAGLWLGRRPQSDGCSRRLGTRHRCLRSSQDERS